MYFTFCVVCTNIYWHNTYFLIRPKNMFMKQENKKIRLWSLITSIQLYIKDPITPYIYKFIICKFLIYLIITFNCKHLFAFVEVSSR